ncbi:MAG: exodeoxyribonuclease VII large subunit [Chlamydiales bacterium]
MTIEEHPLTVTELTLEIKRNVEGTFAQIFLQGEVSNFKQQSSGHLYFSLKDASSQIAAVMFRGSAASLKRIPVAGDQVFVKGSLNVYPPKGQYQLVVRELIFAGLGELLLKLEILKKELHQRGWFSKQHKKPIPKMPRKIGIVTSPTGAAIQDILNILSRRFTGVHIVLNPVRVQGSEAPREIAAAIRQFNEHKLADVLIVCRGGGSIEDLWAFNEEIVAAAIFDSQIPIICAVGHETDHCIAEYVADVRAPTPSAAAELVIAEKAQQMEKVLSFKKRTLQSVSALVRESKHQLRGLERQPVLMNPYVLLSTPIQTIESLTEDLDQTIKLSHKHCFLSLESLRRQLRGLNPISRFHYLRQKFEDRKRNIDQLHKQTIERKRIQLQYLKETLSTINPKNILNRGYSITFSEKTGSVISSIQSINPGELVTIQVSDGRVHGIVDSVEKGR